uniref:PDZ domain-containing protein n=1 Tax=Nothobranchius furzeri TaxID=105023 RepID=A0A8C6MKC8_NOTFU
MPKVVQKKSHWTSRVNEVSVCKDARGDLNVSLRGGAEYGQFAYIDHINEDLVVYQYGKSNQGELLLEVESLSISGLPLYDVQTLISNCKSPVRLKTVRPGKSRRRRWRTQNSLLPFVFFSVDFLLTK